MLGLGFASYGGTTDMLGLMSIFYKVPFLVEL